MVSRDSTSELKRTQVTQTPIAPGVKVGASVSWTQVDTNLRGDRQKQAVHLGMWIRGPPLYYIEFFIKTLKRISLEGIRME